MKITVDELERIARAAYAAYGETTGGKNYQGPPMPDWDDLGEKIQTAWRAATVAVHGLVHHHCADQGQCHTEHAQILRTLEEVREGQIKIMGTQDDINAAVTAIHGVTTDLQAAVANIATELATLEAGNPGVDTSGLQAAVAQLQAVQATVDALETPAAPPADGDGAAAAGEDSGTPAE